jgi:hypothetical protein
MILLFFPLAASGISALVRGSRWRRHTAAAFIVCNPFVVDRVRAGHVALLIGVACLPWLMRSAEHARSSGRWVAVRPAAWYAVAMAVSPHLFWLGGVALVAVAVIPRPGLRDAVRTLQIGLSGCLAYAYGVALYLTDVGTVSVTDADLRAFATVSGPGGLLTTLLSLHGFWRNFTDQARTAVPAAIAIAALAATVVAVVAGLSRAWARERTLGGPALLVGAIGLVLGSGVTGPFAALYTALFDHVPLFTVMREQQKWLALTVVAMAVGVGVAAEWAAEAISGAGRARAGARVLAAGLAAAMALASAPALLWGLGGRVTTSDYPEGWYQADELMESDGSQGLLFLPWHGYQPFGFTGGRGVATPADAFFRTPALSSEAVELGDLRTSSTSRRQKYVDELVARGGADAFSRLVAPLGVRWVVLAHGPEDEAYSWLSRQPDLERVLATPSIDVYRVTAEGTGRVGARRSIPSVAALVLAADDGLLGTEAVTSTGDDDGALPSSASGGITRTSRTTWTVDAGAAGWVVIPEEWSAGWQVSGRSGEPTLAGTVAVRVDAGRSKVEFAPWTTLRLGLAVSVAGLLLLLALGLVEHRGDIALFVGRHSRRHPSART